MGFKSLNRICTGCAQVKPLEEFSRDPRYAYNHKSRCNDCEREYQRSYAKSAKGRAARAAAQRAYMQRLREGGAANLSRGPKDEEPEDQP